MAYYGKRNRRTSLRRRTKRTKRSTFRRRRRSRSRIPRTLIPKKTVRILKYSDTLQLDAGSDIVATSSFTCNGAYDPHVSSILNHQPLGFDQYMGLYDHYTVIGCKMTATFSTMTAVGETGTVRAGILLRGDAGYSNDINTLLEQGYVKYRTVGPLNSGKQSAAVTYKVNPAKYLGIAKPMSNSDLRGTSSSNPTEQCYFMPFVCGIDQSVNPVNVVCNIMIHYTVVFTEPKLIAGS